MKILVLNGPNINMLGIREPGIYGKNTFADLLSLLEKSAAEEGIEIEQYQSNHEGCLVDKIQWAYGKVDGIVINPAAYTICIGRTWATLISSHICHIAKAVSLHA